MKGLRTLFWVGVVVFASHRAGAVMHRTLFSFPALSVPASIRLPELNPAFNLLKVNSGPVVGSRSLYPFFGCRHHNSDIKMVTHQKDSLLALFGGQLDLVREADICEISSLTRDELEPDDFGAYREAVPQELDPVDAATLQFLLTYDHAYDWSGDECDCSSSFCVRFHLLKDHQKVTVDLDCTTKTIRVWDSPDSFSEAKPEFAFAALEKIALSYLGINAVYR